MRTCPQCNRSYPDDINFCFEDGTTLPAGSQIVTAPQMEVPTIVRSSPMPGPQTVPQRFETQITSIPASRRRFRLLLAVFGIVVFIILGSAGGVIAYFVQFSTSKTSGTLPINSAESVSERKSEDAAPDWIDQEKEKLEADQNKLDKQRMQLENGERSLQLAETEPDNFDAQIAAADFYFDTGRFDDAIRKLNRARELKPEDPVPMVMLGNCYFEAKNYRESRNWYQRALEIKPDNVLARTDLGLTYLLEKKPDYERAITEFNRSLEIDPKHLPTLQNLAAAYIAKGDAGKARIALKNFEEADPSNPAIERLRESLKKLER